MKKRLMESSNRAAWGLGDQIFSSATNFGVNILIARSLGAASFGAFSIAFTTYILFLNLSRAVNTEPLTIRFTDVDHSSWSEATRRASACTLLVGLAGSIVCGAVGLLTSGDLAVSFLALAISLPGLLYLDMWRFAFFAQGKGHRAMLTDILWAIFMFPAMFWVLTGPDVSLFLLVMAWAGSAVVGGVIAAIVWGVRPSFSKVRQWLRDHRDLTPSFVGELAAVSSAGQLALIGIGFVASLTVVGAYRAAYVLFGPLRIIFQGMTLYGVPEAVRVLRDSPQRLRRATRVGALVLALVALAYGMALMVMPDRWGEFVLGETWEFVDPLVIPFTIGVMGIGLSMPTYIGLRALEAARDTFITRMIVAGADVVATIVGAAIGGAVGAAWFGRATLFLGSGVWWRRYELRLREREAARVKEVAESMS